MHSIFYSIVPLTGKEYFVPNTDLIYDAMTITSRLRSHHFHYNYYKSIQNTLSYLVFCVLYIYRKPTFSGLGMSFFSYCTSRFKMNCVLTLMSRAYKVCTSYIILNNELCFLKVFFLTMILILDLLRRKSNSINYITLHAL